MPTEYLPAPLVSCAWISFDVLWGGDILGSRVVFTEIAATTSEKHLQLKVLEFLPAPGRGP